MPFMVSILFQIIEKSKELTTEKILKAVDSIQNNETAMRK